MARAIAKFKQLALKPKLDPKKIFGIHFLFWRNKCIQKEDAIEAWKECKQQQAHQGRLNPFFFLLKLI
jgi:hypothetical protein